MRILAIVLLTFALSPLAHAGERPSPCVPGQVEEFRSQFLSFRTGYFPNRSSMEGGFRDRQGLPLRTLQDYLKGKARYVSVAMDSSVLPYGTKLRIPAVERDFHRCIEFRVVDTGGRFLGKGHRKIDICNDNEQHSLQEYTNGLAQIFVLDKNAQIEP